MKFPAVDITDPAQVVELDDLVEWVLRLAPPRTRTMISMRYGLNTSSLGGPHTYKTIGQEVGLSVERVRQVIEHHLRIVRWKLGVELPIEYRYHEAGTAPAPLVT